MRYRMHLQIYLDGTNIVRSAKGREIFLCKKQREEEWENVHIFCVHGMLPFKDDSPLAFCSLARKQARDRARGEGDDATPSSEDNEVELYLSSFPTSQLVMTQIESSIRHYTNVMSTVPSLGSAG